MAKILPFAREQRYKFVQCWKCRATSLIDKTTGVPRGMKVTLPVGYASILKKKVCGFMNAPTVISIVALCAESTF